MSNWYNHGTVDARIAEYETLPFPDTLNSPLIRVTQTWNGTWPGTGFLIISADYPPSGRFGYREVRPDRNPTLLLFPVPAEFKARNFVSREFLVKVNPTGRIYHEANWRIQIESWDGPIANPEELESNNFNPWGY